MSVLPDHPPEPQSASPPEHSGKPSGSRNRVVIAVSTAALTCLLIGGPLAWFMLRDAPIPPELQLAERADAFTQTQITALPGLTLPAQWTPTALPSAAPTREYPLYPTEASPAPLNELWQMMHLGDYGGAVLVLDDMLEDNPENASSYYLRALCYYYLTYNQRVLTEYETYIYRALEDIDRAIALDPTSSGDFYLLRSDVYSRMAQISNMRADFETLYDISADNLKRALELGASPPSAPYKLPLVLTYAGRCEEAMEEAWRLQRVLLPPDAPSASLLAAIGLAEECLGHYERALTYTDRSLAVRDDSSSQLDRAVILYGLGRLDEAKAILDRLIAADRYYGGYRYFVRALIHYELGSMDLAREDVEWGYANTWGDIRVAATLRGLFALDEGDKETALKEFQYAEITTPRYDRPLLDRALRDLAAIGAKPLSEPEMPSYMPTPMPTLAEADRVSPTKPPPGIPTDYIAGSGELNLSEDGSLTVHYRGNLTSPVKQVNWLMLRVVVGGPIDPDQPRVFLWSPRDNFWVPMVLGNGTITVADPQRFVLPTGDLLLSVLEMKNRRFTVRNILPSMEVVLESGETVRLGP